MVTGGPKLCLGLSELGIEAPGLGFRAPGLSLGARAWFRRALQILACLGAQLRWVPLVEAPR